MNRLTPKQARRLLLVLSGPSGSGKSLLERNITENPHRFIGRTVSHTTRPPRKGEVDGVHYHFVTRAEFDALEASGEFLETASIYKGEKYGLTHGEVWRATAGGTKPALIVANSAGYVEIFHHFDDYDEIGIWSMGIWGVWLDAPDETLRLHLNFRGDAKDDIELRMSKVEAERTAKEDVGYDFEIVNDSYQNLWSPAEKFFQIFDAMLLRT